MELREFVRETLVQIIQGVVHAQGHSDVTASTAEIAPSVYGRAPELEKDLRREISV